MIATAGIRRRIEHRGAVYRLRKQLEALESAPDAPLEFVVEGPRGTGKSNGVAYLLWKLCRTYANTRVLVIRTERSLLTDTFCKTYEEDVCPGHVSASPIDRGNRHDYRFPNGSRIVLGGLDKATRYYGSDWDVIVPEEAVQFSWKEIEPFLGSLRNGRLPFHAMIYPTNPDAPRNWVNERCEDKGGPAARMKCYLKDNPSLWDVETRAWTSKGVQFMASLDRYTGVQRDRHVLGLWRGAEGMVWDNFNEDVHVITAPKHPLRELGIVECRAAVDWGTVDAFVFQVWGIDAFKRMVLLAEIHQTGKTSDWWAEQALSLVQEFRIKRMVCDPSRKDCIDLFNDRLAALKIGRIAYGADNNRASSIVGDLAGLDLVRWGFERDATGTPRIRILKDALRGFDVAAKADRKPTCTAEEIPEYVLARDARGELLGDRTDARCHDDGCDTMRYMAMDVWHFAPKPHKEPEVAYAPGTNAALFGTPESLLRDRLRREQALDYGD